MDLVPRGLGTLKLIEVAGERAFRDKWRLLLIALSAGKIQRIEARTAEVLACLESIVRAARAAGLPNKAARYRSFADSLRTAAAVGTHKITELHGKEP